MTSLARLALLSALLAPACGGGGEAGAVGDYLESLDTYARQVCECDHDNGVVLAFVGKFIYGSVDACLDDLPVDSAERGCVEGLFADEEVDYRAVLECRADAHSRAASCLAGKTCTDTARNDCHLQRLDELEDCEALPLALEAKLSDCLHN